MPKNNRKTGSHFEEKVAAFLNEHGFTILDRNFYTKHGEIDLIAEEDGYLVFIEVKYRSSMACGSALEAITPAKAARIRRAAAVYLYQNHYHPDTPCRFDAAGIDNGKLYYVRNAF